MGPDGFTDEEIVSQSVTFIIGVHEDLANVVSYALYLLALNPLVQDRLRTEIKYFFRDYPVSQLSAVKSYLLIATWYAISSNGSQRTKGGKRACTTHTRPS